MRMSASVRLTYKADGRYQLTINGEDMSNHVLSEGFSVEFPNGSDGPPTVTLQLVPDEFSLRGEDVEVDVQ